MAANLADFLQSFEDPLNVLSVILVSIYGIFLFFPLLTEGLLWMK